MKLSTNGTRQPYDSKACAVIVDDSRSSTPLAMIWLSGEHKPSSPEYLPRRSGLACSMAINCAPVDSPPSAKPCRMRSSTSRTGAQTPMLA
jgi:hypothetical protein